METLSAPQSLETTRLVEAISWAKHHMQLWNLISTSLPELRTILTQLQEQSQRFDQCTKKSATMLEASAWTASKTQEFLSTVAELDKVGLQKLVGELHLSVQQTKENVRIVLEELRSINSSINIITGNAAMLVNQVEARQRAVAEEELATQRQRQHAQTRANMSYENRNQALAGMGIGAVIASIIFPPLIPLICCLGITAACIQDNDGDVSANEAIRLQNLQSELANEHNVVSDNLQKTILLRDNLPNILLYFEQVYDFWTKLDTAIGAIRIEGQSKLMYKGYALGWGKLQMELAQNASQLQAL